MSRVKLFDAAVPAAGTSTTTPVKAGDLNYLIAQFAFDYGSGGTTVDGYVQTSIDGGTTWADIMNFSVATTDATKQSKVHAAATMAANYAPTDGTLTANTVKDGLLGDLVRLKLIVVGTYVASTLKVYATGK